MNRSFTQFGVRYGDGEVEETNGTAEDAQEYIRKLRTYILKYGWDPEDYEPMSIVSRTVREVYEVGEWSPSHV